MRFGINRASGLHPLSRDFLDTYLSGDQEICIQAIIRMRVLAMREAKRTADGSSPIRAVMRSSATTRAAGTVPAQGLRAELLGLLGERAARRLMRRFGGQRIRVPHDDRARHRRNVRVIAALQTGSYAAVARRST
jgi:hypothetical protein